MDFRERVDRCLSVVSMSALLMSVLWMVHTFHRGFPSTGKCLLSFLKVFSLPIYLSFLLHVSSMGCSVHSVHRAGVQPLLLQHPQSCSPAPPRGAKLCLLHGSADPQRSATHTSLSTLHFSCRCSPSRRCFYSRWLLVTGKSSPKPYINTTTLLCFLGNGVMSGGTQQGGVDCSHPK